MKKGILAVVLFFVTMSAWAKDLPKQGFGLQIGWAQPILRINDPNHMDTLNNHIKMNGFKVGVVYDGSIIAGFGTSIGLNYTFGAYNGGWQTQNAYGMSYPRSRQMITYNELELFVDWQYKFEIAKETYLMLYTGPTIQCGLEWRMRQDRQAFEGEEYTPKYYSGYKSEDPNQAFKRINVTWGVGAGFQYKRYFVRGGYDFGMIVPYANADFTNGIHTRGRLDQWSIKLGMYLWYEK